MSQPHRILLVNSSLAEGGTERQVAVVAQALDPHRFEVHVASTRRLGFRADEIRGLGIPILHLPVTSFKSPRALRYGLQLARYIRAHRIDLVHSFDVPADIFATPFARLAHRAIVLTSQRAHRNLTPGLNTKLLRFSDRLADGTVVNCEYMRRHLIEDEGVAPGKIHLCYNGIDIAAFHPAEAAADGKRYRAPEFAGADLVIGIVCVLRPEKGLMTLMDAFIATAPAHPQVHMALVGNGPMKAELRQRAATAGLASRVHFVEETPNVAPLYRGIDIFVLPSLTEALSNSLMEAMASGCCPVASCVGGNPELVEDGKNGLLFPPADAPALARCLTQLIEDPAQRQAFAKASRAKIVRQFSTAASIATMQDIYEKFLNAKRPA